MGIKIRVLEVQVDKQLQKSELKKRREAVEDMIGWRDQGQK